MPVVRYRAVDWIAGQALSCPYHAPLEGRLGADWGVIVAHPLDGQLEIGSLLTPTAC